MGNPGLQWKVEARLECSTFPLQSPICRKPASQHFTQGSRCELTLQLSPLIWHLRRLPFDTPYVLLCVHVYALNPHHPSINDNSTGKGTAVVLMYPMSHISLAAVWRACK